MIRPKWLIMIRYFWPAGLWVFIVLLLTGLPGNDLPTLSSFWDAFQPDKIVHMGMFGLLFLLLSGGSFYKGGKVPVSKKLIYTYLFIAIALGGTIELLQKWVFIGRDCDIYDWIADTIGVLLALVFYYVVIENPKQKAN